MKIKFLSIALVVLSNHLGAQHMGNMNYQHQTGSTNYQHQIVLPVNVINVPEPTSNNIVQSIKGLCNVKADGYVAIFSVSQAGTTASEVNQLIEERINLVLTSCKSITGISTYVDMISFVPFYETESVKKIFSKKTYNEVPKGFEVKKNLHIKYSNSNLLNKLISLCSQAEIYDLVRVDYFSDSIAIKKRALMTKANSLLQERMKNRVSIMGIDLANYDKYMAEDYKVVFPVEMYTAYQAYATNSLAFKGLGTVQEATKSTTYYYKPYFDKDFDFVINPQIMEPVIQVVYELKVNYVPKPKEVIVPKNDPMVQKEIQIQKELIMVTSTGEFKSINMGTH
jgi:hypothetical protein